jgi:hypothetical protein
MLSTVAGCSPAQSKTKATGIWFEDNNMGRAGGTPPDLKERFMKPETWAQAREIIEVYYIRSNTFWRPENGLDDEFIQKHFIPVLNQSNIEIAIDSGGATWSSAKDKNNHSEIDLIRKLKSFGGKVNYVGLQSVLSKPLTENGRKVEYPMEQRINDVVKFSQLLKKNFPDIKIGIIDALPTKGLPYKEEYKQLADAMRANKLELDFIHLDCPYEHPQSGQRITWEGVKEVENYVKDVIGTKFGMIATSKLGAGDTSDELFHRNVMDIPNQMHKVGANPNHYVMMSWFPYPQTSIPDNAAEGKYPSLKTTVLFFKQLQSLKGK